jgi:aminocarboxymuconate-semialdehyde decarboxylase
MTPFIDVHCHVTPFSFPENPSAAAKPRWPCMHRASPIDATVMIGDKPFRRLDDRSWDGRRRVEDMDRDGVSVQVLSPMPELLSYWMDTPDAERLCDHTNLQIAEMIAAYPRRFRGLGAVPLQDPERAAFLLSRLKTEFGLSGVEIGSNINGVMLGDPRFEPFYAAAEAQGTAVFVHALHPVAVKAIEVSPNYTGFAGFPIDVAMAAASLIIAGVIERFPRLRIGFSHGGGALGAILGRLDKGWESTERYGRDSQLRPSEQARGLFYDSNVYDRVYLRHLESEVAPGRVFAGTDYPYPIMQSDPAAFIRSSGLEGVALDGVTHLAAGAFLGESFVRTDGL